MADAISPSRSHTVHIARLDRTLRELQRQVREREEALSKLRDSAASISDEPSTDAAQRLHQIRTLTAAYEACTPQEPVLPAPDSPLPSLLALRTTHRTYIETRDELQHARKDLTALEQRLQKETANLSDAHLISSTLDSRIANLETTIRERTQKDPAQVAKDILRDLRRKKEKYDKDTGKLVQSFNRFIDEHLAAMLAAEELGGPVVGAFLDVDEQNLEAGFNTQGKARKPRDAPSAGGRQRRIDEIWGPRRDVHAAGADGGDWNEKTAAAGEMRELTEKLLNSLMEANAGSGDGYVRLERESAAARFLVRSRVAVFERGDARGLRLIDFGRDLDD